MARRAYWQQGTGTFFGATYTSEQFAATTFYGSWRPWLAGRCLPRSWCDCTAAKQMWDHCLTTHLWS